MSKTERTGIAAALTHPVGLTMIVLAVLIVLPTLIYGFTGYDLLAELFGGG